MRAGATTDFQILGRLNQQKLLAEILATQVNSGWHTKRSLNDLIFLERKTMSSEPVCVERFDRLINHKNLHSICCRLQLQAYFCDFVRRAPERRRKFVFAER